MALDRSIPIVLASGSPRRQELLARLELPFEVRVANIDERRLPGEAPDATARRLSLAKARAVAPSRAQALIIAADTLVVVGRDVLGKPVDEREAFAMLARLRNRPHDVLTGLALVDPARRRECVEVVTTRVTMRDYTDDEIRRYIRTGDPMDKAGAYAIQAADLNPVARIEGSYTNVVGLPLCNLYYRLRAWYIPVPVDARVACSQDGGEAASLSPAAGPGNVKDTRPS
jgi:septum formation protein